MLKRYVSNCKVLGDDIYESHATPDTTKQVFGFIRHPATFIHSLWTHRSKKKGHGDEWNWHPDIKLEQECKSQDYNTFVENILERKNIVWDYYQHYLGKYPNVQYCKMEQLPDSLIQVLKLNNEDFDEALEDYTMGMVDELGFGEEEPELRTNKIVGREGNVITLDFNTKCEGEC